MVVAVFKVILSLVTFDILPMEVLYKALKFEENEVPNVDLVSAGYENDSSIMNMGSVTVFFWFSLYILFVLWFLSRVVRDGKQKNQLKTWRLSYNHNQIINLIWANITMIMCCIFVQHRYTKNYKLFSVRLSIF